MSHGPGHVQRAILALMDAHPHGAWITAELCQRVYKVERVEKRHRVAVIRALRAIHRMKLMPQGWYISRQGGPPHERCLFNKRSDKSFAKAVRHWKSGR